LVVHGYKKEYLNEEKTEYETLWKYKVFHIEEMLKCSDPYRKFTLSDLEEKKVFDSEINDKVSVKDLAGIEKYNYIIEDVKLKGQNLILRI
jgi:hypothetical protein